MSNIVQGSPSAYEDDYDPGDIQDDVSYVVIEQHPRVKALRKGYDVTRKYTDLTVAERVYFDYGDNPEFSIFFGGDPTHNYKPVSPLVHNIWAHAIYQLDKRSDIKLFGFDRTAALAPLKISSADEVFALSTGTYVVEYKNTELVLKIYALPGSMEWNWYARTPQEFSAFNTFFKDAVKTYNQYVGKVFDNNGNFVELPTVTFDDIFLPENIRREIQQNIIDYVNEDKLEIKRKNGLPTKRGIIMAGEPGTGKTFLSRVLANTLGVTFMVVTNLGSLGELRNIFKFAKMFDRIVVLFEDLDIYIGNRDRSDIVSEMLNSLDGLSINNHLIALCTTNRLDVLDEALTNRPGRFDRILQFDPPDRALKIEMLRGFCEGKNVAGVDFEKVLKNVSKKYTGAYLKELYITAVTEAIDSDSVDSDGNVILTTDIFLKALKSLRAAQKGRRIGFNAPEEDS